MDKFYGAIGYGVNKETSPGVWTLQITERTYFGDVLHNARRYQSNEQLNDELTINNRISIVADPYAYQHFHEIRYIVWMGTKWTVNSVEVSSPRLVLEIGGVYNVGQR